MSTLPGKAKQVNRNSGAPRRPDAAGMTAGTDGNSVRQSLPRKIVRRRPPNRWLTFAVANFLFLLTIVAAGVINGTGSVDAFTYLALLFLICSTPLVLYDRPNGRYVILLIFAPLFFMDYGLFDIAKLFALFKLPEFNEARQGVLSEAEIAILIGAAMLIAGYVSVAALWQRKSARILRSDWKSSTITVVGLITWAAGSAGTLVWQLGVADPLAHVKLGATAAMGLMVLRMIQPIGAILLIYGYITSKSKLRTALVLMMLATDFSLGFIEASKELMVRSLALLIISSFLINGKVSRKWLITGGVVVALSFSVLQAYRLNVLQLKHETRREALAHFSHNLFKALDSKMVGGDTSESSAKLIVHRTDLKTTMELIMSTVGVTAPYEHGRTMRPLLYVFIPRILLPHKPRTSVGRIFTRDFHTSLDRNSYTSATQMGELYWNFGWPGLVIGMYCIGALLGFVGATTNLTEIRSVTRLLIILSTVYLICLRFEGGIGLQYTLWIRSVVMILLLHMMFRRRYVKRSTGIRSMPPQTRLGSSRQES